MFSMSRAFLACSLLVSGIVAAPVGDHSLKLPPNTCGVFALIGSGFNTTTNFMLAAFPPADTLATSGGTALVVGSLTDPGNPLLFAAPSGVTSGTIFNLTSGTLSVTDHEADISFTVALLSNGSDVSFTPSNGAPLTIPQFCAIADTDPEAGTPFPTLAVEGTTNDFAFCDSTALEGTQIVVFRPLAGNGDYDFSTCEPMNILLTGPAF